MFEEILEKQRLPVEFFSKSLEKSQIARAYLLTGAAKADKLALVKELNQILNCKVNSGLFEAKANKVESENSLFAAAEDIGTANLDVKFSYQEACGKCQNCEWIASGEHPRTPIILSTGDGAKKNIKIEKIRELQTELAQSSEYTRIMIIEDASSRVLNKFSATALLKTIEEAKPNTIFMLLADSKDTVLPTITSRSQVISFKSNEEMEFSESSQVLLEELKNTLNSGKLSSRLEQLIEAEELAKNETDDLVQMLALMQNEISDRISADFTKQAELVISIDKAIRDLRSFVRPKAVFGALLKEF